MVESICNPIRLLTGVSGVMLFEEYDGGLKVRNKVRQVQRVFSFIIPPNPSMSALTKASLQMIRQMGKEGLRALPCLHDLLT